jgi:hypothetical protein
VEKNNSEQNAKSRSIPGPAPQTARPQPAGRNSEIRYWRVGTFSMGLTLIALGLFLILGRFFEVDILYYIVNFWPLMIIVLGLEIILFNSLAFSKKSRFRFTYDFLSIFLVIVFLAAGAGFYFLESSGLFAAAQRFFLSSARVVEEEKLSCSINDGLQSLSLEVESGDVILKAYEGDEIKISAIYKGYFLSKEEAEAYAKEQMVKGEHLGNTLYVKIFRPANSHHLLFHHEVTDQEITVLIPETINVEVLKTRGNLQLHLPAVKSNWSINHEGNNSQVYLDSAEDTRLAVEILRQGDLQGNVTWDLLETREEKMTGHERTEQELAVPQDVKPWLKAVKSWGEGTHSISLRQARGNTTIKVNSEQ